MTKVDEVLKVAPLAPVEFYKTMEAQSLEDLVDLLTGQCCYRSLQQQSSAIHNVADCLASGFMWEDGRCMDPSGWGNVDGRFDKVTAGLRELAEGFGFTDATPEEQSILETMHRRLSIKISENCLGDNHFRKITQKIVSLEDLQTLPPGKYFNLIRLDELHPEPVTTTWVIVSATGDVFWTHLDNNTLVILKSGPHTDEADDSIVILFRQESDDMSENMNSAVSGMFCCKS